MKEINFYKEMISQIEKNERKLKVYYSDVSNYSIKKYITDFIKQIAKRSGSVDIAFSMMMPSPEQLEDQTFLIKNPVKVKINPNGTHQLFSNFGTGYFSNPKVFDKNVYCKEQHCHSAAFMFAISHLDLQPVILTGFYNRLENDLDDLKKGFLHSVCLFSVDGEYKVFDGSHAIIMDANLYKTLFNFKPVGSITSSMLIKDIKILKDRNFSVLEYLLERERVLKNNKENNFDDSKNL